MYYKQGSPQQKTWVALACLSLFYATQNIDQQASNIDVLQTVFIVVVVMVDSYC